MNTKLLSGRNVLLGIRHFALITIFATLLHGCTDEQTHSPINPDGETMITFSINAPSGFSATTYGLATGEEDAVNTVDVLLFENNGGTFVSGPHYGAIDANKNVTIRIPEATSKTYDMVILANCRGDLNQTFTGKTKETVLSTMLTRTVAATGHSDNKVGGTHTGWLTTTGNKSIPMSAETTVVYNENGAASVTGSTDIKVTRMLAKVNVSVTGTATSVFTLTNVYLCNYQDAGRIAPSAAGTLSVVGTKQTGDTNAIKYTAISDNKCLNEIYTFEAAAGTADNTGNPCIVIGGRYNGGDSDVFYRIDFVDGSGYLPLLRNHEYGVSITTVSGPGYGSMKQALESRPVNIKYDITPWDASKVVNVVYDGQYALGISQNEFTFDKALRDDSSADNTITVTTNFPTDWTVSTPTNPSSWLTASKSGNTVRLTCSENTTNGSRTATVRITAGRMVQDISVTQIKDEVAIAFTGAAEFGDQVLFTSAPGAQPASKNFSVAWTPSDAKLTFTNTAVGGNAFTFSGTSIPAGDILTGGTKSYTIQPTNVTSGDMGGTSFLEKSSAINYTLTYGGKTVTRTLVLTHQVTAESLPPLPVSINAAAYYPRTGAKEKFFITSISGSNVSWTVKSVTGANFTNVTPSGTASTTTSTNAGNIVEFTTDNAPSTNAQVIVILGSPDGTKETKVPLNVGGTYTPTTSDVWAGSNVYWVFTDTGTGTGYLTFDDTDTNPDVVNNERKLGVFFQHGSLFGISPTPSNGNDWSTVSSDVDIYYPDGRSEKASVNFATYTDIPKAAADASRWDDTTAYLYEQTGAKVSVNETDYPVGDICKWITDQGWAPGSTTGTRWRMPTTADFGSVTKATYSVPPNNDETATWNDSAPSDATGQGLITINQGRWITGHTYKPYFPAAVYRYPNGTLSSDVAYSRYWSGSPSGAYSRTLDVYGSATFLGGAVTRTTGCSVRCVREI